MIGSVCNPLGCIGIVATVILVALIVIVGGFGKNP